MTSALLNAAVTTGVRSTKNRRATARGVSTLMYACQQGDVETVRNIIREQSESLSSLDRTGKTPLHYCSTSDNIRASQAADLLVMAAPDLVEAHDEDGFTPLHLAVISGNISLVTFLLANKADVNAVDNEKHTLVHWATVCGETAALRAVLAAGAPVSTPDVHGGYPLHYAAQMCGGEKDSDLGLQVLHTLLAHSDIVVSVEDGDQRQPLLWAASAGSTKAVLALVRAGALVEAPDKDGLTALHCAASRGHTDCIDTVLTLCGASPDVIDTNGCTALHYAVTLGHADATALLLAHGAVCNRQDRKGRSPAHCGCAKGQLETVKMLGAQGANLWLRNARGDLPLHDAAGSGRRDLVRWLLEMRPSQVNARNNDGRCPLHLSALNDNVDMCKILLDVGAQVNPILRTSKNTFMTPLDCALQRGFRSTAKYLQLHGGLPASRMGDPRYTNPNLNLQIRDDVTFWGDTSSDSERENGQSTKNSKRTQRKKLSSKFEKRRSITGSDLESKLLHRDKSKRKVDENQRLKTGAKPDSSVSRIDYKRTSSRTSEKFDYTNEIIINGKTEINIHQTKQITIGKDGDVIERNHSVAAVDEIEQKVKEVKSALKKPSSSVASAKKETIRKNSPSLLEVKNSEAEERKSSKLKAQKSKSNTKTSPVVEKKEVEKQTPKLEIDPPEKNSNEEIQKSETLDQQSIISNSSEDVQEHERLVVQASVHQAPIEEKKVQLTSDQNHIEEIVNNEEVENKIIVEEKTEGTLAVEEKKDVEEEIQKGESKEITEATDHSTTLETQIPEEEESIKPEAITKEEELIQVKESFSQVELARKENSEASTQELQNVNNKLTEATAIEVPENDKDKILQNETITELKEPKDHQVEEKSEELPPDAENIKIVEVDEKKTEDSSMEEVQKPNDPESNAIERSSDEPEEVTVIENIIKEEIVEKTIPTTIEETDVLEKPLEEQENKEDKDKEVAKLSSRKSKSKRERKRRQSKEKQDQAYEIIYKTIGESDDADVEKAALASKMSAKDSLSETTSDSSSDSTQHKSFRILPEASTHPRRRKSKSPPKRQRSRSEETKVESRHKSRIPTPLSRHQLNIPGRATKSNLEHRVPSLPNIHESRDEIRADSNMSAPLLASIYSDQERGSGSDLEDTRGSALRKKKFKKKMKVRDTHSDYESSNVIDSGFEPSPRSTRIPRWKNMSDRGVDMTSVTQSIQTKIRRYHLERKIFQHLLNLKHMQIRTGQHNETILVKRAIDSYHHSCAATVGAGRYTPADFTYKSFEKFLYHALRKLQKSSPEYLKGLPEAPDNPLLCTQSTHRCNHATHAYTGIPCAAYLPKMDHHSIPKVGFGSTQCKPGFLPKIDPKKTVTLELCHGTGKQVISLPADRLDQNKRYYVTFTVKGNDGGKVEEPPEGHTHPKSD